MTLAVGVSCPEGAVIAADRMLLTRQHDENEWHWQLASKIWPLKRWQGGYTTYGVWDEPGPRESLTATALSIQNRLRSRVDYDIDREHAHEPGTLAAGAEDGRVRMALLSGGECRVAPATGALHLLGYAADWEGVRIFSPRETFLGAVACDVSPANLETCEALALFIARNVIQIEYSKHGGTSLEECISAGNHPGVAYPIDLAILRPGREMELKTCHSR